MIDLTNHTLGKTDQLLEVDLKEDLQQLILTMSQQAKQRILIFSHHLEHSLFDNDELYEAIKLLAIKNQRTHIHILLQDINSITIKDHRLLKLARRISSHISIKLAAKEHQDIFETFMIFDNSAYILLTHPERYDALGNFYGPLKTGHLSEQFEELWQRATVDSSLRRLSL